MRFKDLFSIIGPAMVGPSSSHTAGAVRIGRVARQLLGVMPNEAVIELFGSFAETYRGHGTDLAIVGGLLDYETDDLRINQAMDIAEALGIQIIVKPSSSPAPHPNTTKLLLSAGKLKVSITGASIGGGTIEILNVDGFDVRFSAMYPTLVITHNDKPGVLACMTQLIGLHGMNIGYMDVDRKGRNDEAMTVIEMDGGIDRNLIDELMKLPEVIYVRTIHLIGGDTSCDSEH